MPRFVHIHVYKRHICIYITQLISKFVRNNFYSALPHVSSMTKEPYACSAALYSHTPLRPTHQCRDHQCRDHQCRDHQCRNHHVPTINVPVPEENKTARTCNLAPVFYALHVQGFIAYFGLLQPLMVPMNVIAFLCRLMTRVCTQRKHPS